MDYKFIMEKVWNDNTAGSKARTDFQDIVASRYNALDGIIQIRHVAKNTYGKIKFFLQWNSVCIFLRLLFDHCDNAVIMQYPFLSFTYAMEKFMHHNKVALFVIDADCIRYPNDKKLLCKEVRLFNAASVLVLHNESMIQRLKELGVVTPMVNLEMLDYLFDNERSTVFDDVQSIMKRPLIFAGNLKKSRFLYRVDKNKLKKELWLYGNGFDSEKNKYLTWKGAFLPKELPLKMKGSFGLIWDGESTTTCSGDYGEYLRYNHPHKMSLYIVSGLPVIVWSQAAVKNIVMKYNIGFCVDDLAQIDARLAKITEAEYKMYIANVDKLKKKLMQGFFTNRALDHVERLLMGEII